MELGGGVGGLQGSRGGGHQGLLLFDTLALKMEKTRSSRQSVSQSVKTAQTESTCLRRGASASKPPAVWIQFRSAAPSPSWLGPVPAASWRVLLHILPVCMCVSVRVVDVQEPTVMFNRMSTFVLERVQARTRALRLCSI